MAIQARLMKFLVPESEWENYVIDQEINDRGIAVDNVFVSQAIRCDERSKAACLERAKKLTGLENPNSPLQLMDWLRGKGLSVESLTKSEKTKMLRAATGDVREVLELRQQLSKTSVKKYMAMEQLWERITVRVDWFSFMARTGRGVLLAASFSCKICLKTISRS